VKTAHAAMRDKFVEDAADMSGPHASEKKTCAHRNPSCGTHLSAQPFGRQECVQGGPRRCALSWAEGWFWAHAAEFDFLFIFFFFSIFPNLI
jgi:hypothetical protein